MDLAVIAGWLAMAAVTAFALPALAARAHTRSLAAAGRTVANHRGRPVAVSLGVAFLAWSIGTGALAAGWGVFGGYAGAQEFLGDPLVMAVLAPVFAMPHFLVIGAYALGLLDDTHGDRSRSGLREHLGALSRGELTTGALKLLGIGALALVQTSSLAFDNGIGVTGVVLTWVLAAVVVAASANTVNLMDLRPARALKAYGLLAVLACASLALDPRQGWASAAEGWLASAMLGVLLLGPLAAVWTLDAGERAMLGDAGANAAGALAGYMLALALPLPMLAIAAVALVALNLAAERVSFSAIIEGNRVLAWADGLGRPKDGQGGAQRD